MALRGKSMNNFSRVFLIFLLAVNLRLPALTESASHHFDCLGDEFKSTDIVSYREKRKGSGEFITIEDKLIEMKAQCKKGKLIDSKGREIKFFKFACFGNPPADYEEIRQKENEELEKLQKDYTVIILECDPRTN